MPIVTMAVSPLLRQAKYKERKTTQAAKSSSHQSRKWGRLSRKAPSPEKKKAVSENQEGCGQTSQQTSPNWFKVEENAQENVWSKSSLCKCAGMTAT